MTDIIERTEAALTIECGCNQPDCGFADLELGGQARELLPILLTELKTARAENERLRHENLRLRIGVL